MTARPSTGSTRARHGPRRGEAARGEAESRTTLRSERGQATVELVALLPMLVVVVLAAAHLLAAGAAAELAGHAAEAAAVAVLQGTDPRTAARDAVPGWSRSRMSVRVDGRRIRVRLRPPSAIPALADLLVATREADAGPAPG